MTRDVVTLATSGSVRRLVRYLRRQRGWDQARLAGRIGRSQQWVSSFEAGATEASLGDALHALTTLGASVMLRDTEPEHQLGRPHA